jgi:hypothetical protein
MSEPAEGSREMSNAGRVFSIVMIFVVLGPLVGGLVFLGQGVFYSVYRNGVDLTGLPNQIADLFNVIVFTSIFAYIVGGGLAALTGLTVAIWRLAAGRTTIVAPIAGALLAIAVAVLLPFIAETKISNALPIVPESIKFFLAPSLCAALVCWLVARKGQLA